MISSELLTIRSSKRNAAAPPVPIAMYSKTVSGASGSSFDSEESKGVSSSWMTPKELPTGGGVEALWLSMSLNNRMVALTTVPSERRSW